MPGSIDLDSFGGPFDAGDAAPVGVFWYYGGGAYAAIPNVVPVTVDVRAGLQPAAAVLRYMLDDSGLTGWPSRAEQLWPIGAQGPYVVQADDRIVVAVVNPDGSLNVLFDGFAQAPQMDVTREAEHVTFTAVGVSARTWDAPIVGRVERAAFNPEDTTGRSDVAITGQACRFNPSGQGPGWHAGILGNATSYHYYTVNSQTGNYPVFLDPLVQEYDIANSTNYVDPWKISGALKYLIVYRLLVQLGGANDWVTWPDLSTLHVLLQVLSPPRGSAVINSSTWQTADAAIRDYDASGKPIPVVVSDLLGYAGFLTSWYTTTDGSGNPATSLDVFRVDAGAAQAPKTVYYPAEGATADYADAPASALHFNRDANALTNAYVLETRPKLVEVTVQLAPLFLPAAADAPAADRRQFLESSWTPSTTATVRRKYRWYGADEGGDGHYNALTQTWWTGRPIDWSPAFPPNSDGTPSYAGRYRPGGHRAIALDSGGRPLHAVLEIATNYTSIDPFVQVSSSAQSWTVVSGGWRLLTDRFGIEVTVEDPEQWNGGKAAGDIRGITWQATPAASGAKPFTLRLTTVVESDQDLGIGAPARIASPTQYPRWRSADARDHFQYACISPGSRNYAGAGGDGTHVVVVRDDTAAAQAHADQLRARGEFPPITGTVRIPYLTTYYRVGDRISGVGGRGISLQTNIAIDQGETPCYPWVAGVQWSFEGKQETILHLTDAHAHGHH